MSVMDDVSSQPTATLSASTGVTGNPIHRNYTLNKHRCMKKIIDAAKRELDFCVEVKSNNVILSCSAGMFLLLKRVMLEYYADYASTRLHVVNTATILDDVGNSPESQIQINYASNMLCYRINMYPTTSRMMINGRGYISQFLNNDLVKVKDLIKHFNCHEINTAIIRGLQSSSKNRRNRSLSPNTRHISNTRVSQEDNINITPKVPILKALPTNIATDWTDWTSDTEAEETAEETVQHTVIRKKNFSTIKRLNAEQTKIVQKEIISVKESLADLQKHVEDELSTVKCENKKLANKVNVLESKNSKMNKTIELLSNKYENSVNNSVPITDSNSKHTLSESMENNQSTNISIVNSFSTNSSSNSSVGSVSKYENVYRPIIEELDSSDSDNSDSNSEFHDMPPLEYNQSVDSNQPLQSNQSLESNQPLESNQTLESNQSLESVDSNPLLESNQSLESNQPVESNQPLESNQSLESNHPVQWNQINNDFFCSNIIEDSGSKYKGFSIEISSMQDMRHKQADFITRNEHVMATHIMIGYNIGGKNVDEGEDGGSRVIQNLLKELKVSNVMVIVTRVFGGKHLGKRRWEHMRTCATEALKVGNFIQESKPNQISPVSQTKIPSSSSSKSLMLSDSVYTQMNVKAAKLNAFTLDSAIRTISKSSENQRKDLIIVGTGINNLKNGDSVQSIKNKVDTLVETVKQTHPQAKLALCSLLPTKSGDLDITKVNNYYKYLCRSDSKIAYIDTFSSVKAEMESNNIHSDNIHLNAHGYAFLQSSFEDQLNTWVYSSLDKINSQRTDKELYSNVLKKTIRGPPKPASKINNTGASLSKLSLTHADLSAQPQKTIPNFANSLPLQNLQSEQMMMYNYKNDTNMYKPAQPEVPMTTPDFAHNLSLQNVPHTTPMQSYTPPMQSYTPPMDIYTTYADICTTYAIIHTPYAVIHTTYAVIHPPYAVIHITYAVIYTTYAVISICSTIVK